MKFLRLRLISFLFCLLPIFACAQTDQQNPDRSSQDLLDNLLLLNYLSSGNCLVSTRSGTEMGTLKCSRANRSQCDHERLYDVTGGLVTTAETRSRINSEIVTLGSDYPSCSAAAVLVLLLPAFTTDTDDAATTSKSNNILSVISSCDSLNNSNAGKLATNAEYTHLTSARGVLAQQAKSLGSNDCLSALYGSGTNQTLVENLASGDLLLEVSCLYGSGWGTQTCTTEEKAAANVFDFVVSF